MAICNEKTRKDIQNRLSKCLFILQKYNWLHNSLLHDFFVERHWEKLALGWRSSLNKLSHLELAKLLSYWENDSSTTVTVLPLELLALRSCVRQLSLNRAPVQNVQEAFKYFDSRSVEDVDTGSSGQKLYSEWQTYEELTRAGGQHRNLNHIFRKHVKPKKQHEIARLASLVKFISNSADFGQIVDVGSGVGHLSRLLTYAYKLKAVSIDAKESHVASALTFDFQLEKQLEKKLANQELNTHEVEGIVNGGETFDTTCPVNSGPSHLAQYVDFEDEASIKTLLACFKDSDFGVIGLHTCGDLGSALIKFYSQSEEAKALCSVACCHMRLTTFPLSEYLSLYLGQITLDQGPLSYLSKELSCHAIETYVKRLKTNEENCKLKVHCYRALLELLIQDTNPKLKHSALKSVPRCHTIAFKEYALKATQLLKIDFDFENEKVEERITTHLNEWWKVVVFYSLRLLFAPIIETVILLDRCLYLLEHGFESCLVPIFDPELSPRNHVLVSMKKACD